MFQSVFKLLPQIVVIGAALKSALKIQNTDYRTWWLPAPVVLYWYEALGSAAAQLKYPRSSTSLSCTIHSNVKCVVLKYRYASIHTNSSVALYTYGHVLLWSRIKAIGCSLNYDSYKLCFAIYAFILNLRTNLHNATGVPSQDIKGNMVIAEGRHEVVGTTRSNFRKNTTAPSTRQGKRRRGLLFSKGSVFTRCSSRLSVHRFRSIPESSSRSYRFCFRCLRSSILRTFSSTSRTTDWTPKKRVSLCSIAIPRVNFDVIASARSLGNELLQLPLHLS